MLRDERAKSARTNPTGAAASIENARTNPATVRPNEPNKRSPKRTQEADRLRFPKAYRLPASPSPQPSPTLSRGSRESGPLSRRRWERVRVRVLVTERTERTQE